MEQSYVIRNDRVIGKTVPNINYNYSTCPIGSIFAFSSERIPLGFLICDGASYKVAEYPDLYAVIGNTYGGDTENFNVPDYRETVLVGVGENTTDTIASHDVYELGEFKDDQMQSHTHDLTIPNHVGGSWQVSTTAKAYYSTQTITQTSTASGTGTTTHGKQKGVTYIIKAFHTNEGVDSGVSDDVIEYVDNKVATKQENIYKKHITSRKGDASDTKPYCLIATLKTSNLTFVNEPIIIEGVMGNATSSTQKMLFKASFDFRNGAKETAKVIYGYINQSSLFSHIDLFATFDESAEMAYIYVHHKTNYSIIDADISVPQRNAELYLTIPETFEKTDTIIGTEAHRMSTSTNVKVLAGLDDTASSTTSTYSSAKIDEKYGAYTFGTASSNMYLKFKLGSSSSFQPVTVCDQYGGKIEILGMANDGTYKSVKKVRYSYGCWSKDSATETDYSSPGDANYKIKTLYYHPDEDYYYLDIRQWCTIKVYGAIIKPELVASLPAGVTSIPESDWGRISDSETSETSTWSSSKIASEINPTIDISKVFSDGVLNISTLYNTYGNGRYVIVGQGTAGNGSATIDIWTLASNAISYVVNVTYSNRTSNVFVGLTYENPTINFETSYLSACNHIAKVCTLA